MSQLEILATFDALLTDATRGLQAKAAALAAGDTEIMSTFELVPWALAGTMRPATQVNVMLRPGSWRADAKNIARPERDAVAQVEIGVELFAADPVVIQKNVTLIATALAQVVDDIVDYARETGGTIYDVDDPMEFLFGQFTGPTSHGFLARVTVLERSSQ